MMTISIIGCGWLGLPLGASLVGKGYTVKGSTTTESKLALLEAQGISAYLFNVNEVDTVKESLDLFDCDLLFLNIPPRSRHPELAALFPAKVALILKQLKTSTKIIFASTTGVYQDVNADVDEQSLLKEGHPVVLAEKLLLEQGFDATILRFAGLIGGDRHPAKNLAGRELNNGDAKANLVHRVDCVQIVKEIIGKEKWGRIYNVCADKNPSRKDIYTQKAIAMKLEPPRFVAPHLKSSKTVKNDFLKEDLGYQFLMPDPMDF